jgi:hypothetical protein
VSKKDDEVARLERLNEQLGESLKRCRDMLHDYQARLAANSNDPHASDGSTAQTASDEG